MKIIKIIFKKSTYTKKKKATKKNKQKKNKQANFMSVSCVGNKEQIL